jgi:uncharacterized protein YecE (DUF72 family)
MSLLRFGTCSWPEKSWVGPFDPPGTKPADDLQHYATAFDTVEADSTYYACPPIERLAGWSAATPDHFTMSAKMPRTCFLGDDARELDAARVLNAEAFGPMLETWHKALAGLGPKAGPVVIQLPYLRKTVFRDLEGFVARLDPFLTALPAGPRIAVEVRNREYLHPELVAMLKTHRAALVLSEFKGMPHPDTTAGKLDVLTTDFFYARLIGDRAAVESRTKSFDETVIDAKESLGRWAHLLRTMASSADGFVYANNHFEGHGPATVHRLCEAVAACG